MLRGKVVLTAMLAVFMTACTRPVTTPPMQSGLSETQQAALTAQASTATPSASPTQVATATETPEPTETPTPELVFEDLSRDSWGFEAAERMFELGVIEPCSTSPLMVCPERTFTRAQKALTMYRVLELTINLEPSLSSPVFYQDVASLSTEEIVKLEELQRRGYLPRKMDNGSYQLEAFLCRPSYLTDAVLYFCPDENVTMAEMFASAVLLVHGPEVEDSLPVYSQEIFRDLPLSNPYSRWAIAAVSEEIGDPLYEVGYRAGRLGPDMDADWIRWVYFLDLAYQRLGGE